MNLLDHRLPLFLIVALLVYHVLPRRPQNWWLLLVSYLFYATWAWQFGLILLGLTLANFWLAQGIERDGAPRHLLWLGVGLNLAALIVLRMADFFVPGLVALMTATYSSLRLDGLQILIPIGLSYYVLENISYLIDVSRRQVKACRDFVDFALYLAYFPKLLAGPIERARTFLPQIARQRVVDNRLLARSLALIAVGLVRKVIVADSLHAALPWDLFAEPANFGGPELWAWLVVYAFILYNDFAGYTDMVRGVSGLFGIELSANFRQPYFARNFAEFWNRWHISLSHWLRDYIYFPMSRALLRRNPDRRNLANVILPPLVTMLASGFWHGFSWHMALWGGLHGLYQMGERLPALWRPVTAPHRQAPWRQVAAGAVIFLLVLWAWVPFRLELPLAMEFWIRLLDWSDWGLRYRRILLALPLISLVVLFDWAQYRSQDDVVMLRWPRLAQAGLLAVAMFLVLIAFRAESVPPFIYQGF